MINNSYKEILVLRLGTLSFMLVTMSRTFQKLFMQYELHIWPYIKEKVENHESRCENCIRS
jgi:cellulose synthase/poly-beta-1,6-N-acetylglucosamine synthase-like glycosyltransferase